MIVDWDAGRYHAAAAPMEEMGVATLSRLPLTGSETVLDVGCGSGRVTAHLCERLPTGSVIGIDLSTDMVEIARETLGGHADIRVGDVLDLELDSPVDAIVSTATFHWIPDHDRLFAKLWALLRPGGRLVAQCGGCGNIRRTLAAAAEVAALPPFAPWFDGWRPRSTFASAEETERRLRDAGFTEVRCWLTETPAMPGDLAGYLQAVALRDHVEPLPGDLHEPFAAAVAQRLGSPAVVDYVRLNIEARRPGR